MKGERGSTLIGLLIATAITGLTVSLLGTAAYQVLTTTDYASGRMIAMHELQNAAYWVGRDGQSAGLATGGDSLVLTLPDETSITYLIVGTEFCRTAGESQMTIAQNISDVSFSVEDGVITMSITASPEGRPDVSEQRTYKICLRPTGEEE